MRCPSWDLRGKETNGAYFLGSPRKMPKKASIVGVKAANAKETKTQRPDPGQRGIAAQPVRFAHSEKQADRTENERIHFPGWPPAFLMPGNSLGDKSASYAGCLFGVDSNYRRDLRPNGLSAKSRPACPGAKRTHWRGFRAAQPLAFPTICLRSFYFGMK